MRNVDKIKQLEHEIGRYRKKVADDAKEKRELKEQLDAFQRGSNQVHKLVDALLVCMAQTYGVKVTDDETGEELGWRLELAQKPDTQLLQRYEVRTRASENGGYTVGVLPREVG